MHAKLISDSLLYIHKPKGTEFDARPKKKEGIIKIEGER